LARCASLRVVVRATTPHTDELEIALVERDSAAWGTTIPIDQNWREIDVPLSDLKFFAHWPHPEGRGGTDDQIQLAELAAVNFCFGAWLFGDRADRPHGVDIESAWLVLADRP
jgi:hypothetical protein